MILDHIARARRMGLAYVYLGYWVRDSRKMDYKGRFLPQERLLPDGWTRVEALGAEHGVRDRRPREARRARVAFGRGIDGSSVPPTPPKIRRIRGCSIPEAASS